MEVDIIINYHYPLTLTITQPCIIILILHIAVSIAISLTHRDLPHHIIIIYSGIQSPHREHINKKHEPSRREDKKEKTTGAISKLNNIPFSDTNTETRGWE